MTIDHQSKIIHATRSETFAVANYIKYCTLPGERQQWKVAWEMTHTSTIKYGRRDKKTESQGEQPALEGKKP